MAMCQGLQLALRISPVPNSNLLIVRAGREQVGINKFDLVYAAAMCIVQLVDQPMVQRVEEEQCTVGGAGDHHFAIFCKIAQETKRELG